MDALLTAAAAGLRSRAESLDMLANNLANAGTAGFKADRESFADYLGAEAAGPLPDLVANFVDLAQGPLTPTSNPLDVAIEGPGFLAVIGQDPALSGAGEVLLTRSGQLQVGGDGVLRTGEGLPLRGEDGAPIRLDAARPVTIDADGTVRQGGAPAGKIDLVNGPREILARRAGTTFRAIEPARLTRADVALRSGYLESSNVSVPEAAIRLVSVLREFEMMQRAISLGAEMNRRATEEVARVGS